MSFMMVALLILQEVPDKPLLKIGDTIEYDRSMVIVLTADGTGPGMEKAKGEHKVTMDATYGFTVEGVGGGFDMVMKVTRLKLGQSTPKGKAVAWELPAGQPLDLKVHSDPRGRLQATLPAIGAECLKAGSARLRKIPGVYFWSFKNPNGPGGSFMSGPELPEQPGAAWSYTSDQLYGPGGLLDDFSSFQEVWKIESKKGDEKSVECELTLQEVKVVSVFGVTSLEIKEKQGRGVCRFDPKSGLTLSCEMEHSFSFAGTADKSEFKGTIRRVEKLGKR